MKYGIIPVLASLLIDGNINYPGYDPVAAENLAIGSGGPFETVCSVLMVVMILGILGTFFIKKDVVRMVFSLVTSAAALAAMILYPINQVSYGGAIPLYIMFLLLVGLVFGIAIFVIRHKKAKQLRVLGNQAAAAESKESRSSRRFDD